MNGQTAGSASREGIVHSNVWLGFARFSTPLPDAASARSELPSRRRAASSRSLACTMFCCLPTSCVSVVASVSSSATTAARKRWIMASLSLIGTRAQAGCAARAADVDLGVGQAVADGLVVRGTTPRKLDGHFVLYENTDAWPEAFIASYAYVGMEEGPRLSRIGATSTQASAVQSAVAGSSVRRR